MYPQTSTRTSLSVTSSRVLRSACCCFQSSTRTPVCTSISMTTTSLYIWRTFRFWIVVHWLFVHVASFPFSMGLDDFSQTNHAIYYFMPQLWPKMPGKIDCFRRTSNCDHSKRWSGLQSPRNSACPFLIGSPLHACWIRGNIRSLYCTILLHHCICTWNYRCWLLCYWRTVLLYCCCTVLYCCVL